MNKYNVIGLMSGTSLDGLDIAYCTFKLENGKWRYSINCAETISYNKEWNNKLKGAHLLSGEILIETHNEYGEYSGRAVLKFMHKNKLKNIDFVSSHGHTVFHKPDKGYTFQLGNGATLAAVCGLRVICDFRTLDVALKGQGAPLVPIGDRLLFPEYDYCLNLGGFSNISFEQKGKRIAFDICPVNIVLNYIASTKGKEYDKDGLMAKAGKVNNGLLNKLNKLSYYRKVWPKSLGREWVEDYFLPQLNSFSISAEDKLATVTEHIALQISAVVKDSGKVLVTGGGANNKFLILKLKEKLFPHQIVIPSKDCIDFKEALVFAFLGVLKSENKINTLKSVTGAIKDSSGGIIYNP